MASAGGKFRGLAATRFPGAEEPVSDEDAPPAGRRQAGEKRRRAPPPSADPADEEDAPADNGEDGAGAGDNGEGGAGGAEDQDGDGGAGGDGDGAEDEFDDSRTVIEKAAIVQQIREYTRQRKLDKRTHKNRRPWSDAETKLLWRLHAVAFNRGYTMDKWHQILRAGWETFKVQGRTSVDLKDKWTILERRGLRDLKADAALHPGAAPPAPGAQGSFDAAWAAVQLLDTQAKARDAAAMQAAAEAVERRTREAAAEAERRHVALVLEAKLGAANRGGGGVGAAAGSSSSSSARLRLSNYSEAAPAQGSGPSAVAEAEARAREHLARRAAAAAAAPPPAAAADGEEEEEYDDEVPVLPKAGPTAAAGAGAVRAPPAGARA